MIKKLIKISVIIVTTFLILVAVGFLLLRNSAYWPAVTLFSDNHRAERFKSMDEVFPQKSLIQASHNVWEFDYDLQLLPTHYTFEDETFDVKSFLERTETTGLAVLHKDSIVFESYYQNYTDTSQATSWSLAKSFVSALVGIAIQEGAIDSIHDPITYYVESLENTAYDGVLIKDILTMSSGVDFNEDYDSFDADINMIFIRNFAFGEPMGEYLKRLDGKWDAGTYNNYISSDTLALSMLVSEATNTPLSTYLEEKLWQPMGAEHDAFWILDSAEKEIGFCCLNAILRDYLRFGTLYLNGGARNDNQIIPSQWVEDSISIHGDHLKPGDNPNSFWTFGYGYQWWLPEDPEGDFTAIGVWGQYIYVHPEHDIVIVKTSTDGAYDENDHETIAFFRTLATHFSSND